MRKKGKYLGEMLVGKGLVSEAQLKTIMEEQLKNKKFLGEMLMESGLISEEDLFKTIAEQFDIEYTSLPDEEIDWDIAIGFSSSIITEHKCLPLRLEGEAILLAITNPLDAWVLETAEKEAAPKKIKVILVMKSDMEVAVKEYHKRSIRKMMNKWKND